MQEYFYIYGERKDLPSTEPGKCENCKFFGQLDENSFLKEILKNPENWGKCSRWEKVNIFDHAQLQEIDSPFIMSPAKLEEQSYNFYVNKSFGCIAFEK